MTGFWYLFAAYTIVWVVLWGYTVWLGKKQAFLFEKIESLRKISTQKGTSVSSRFSDP